MTANSHDVRIVICAAIVLIVSSFGFAEAGTWSPTPNDPALDPAQIKVGAGYVDSGATISCVHGTALTLIASAKDSDTLTIDEEAQDPADDPDCKIDWSQSAGAGGTFSGTRSNTGAQITWTAPTLGAEEASRLVTITATPDDDSTENPGGPLGDHGGNRNDNPCTAGAATVIIKVIKACPTTADLGEVCVIAPETVWPLNDQVRTWGYRAVQTVVSGGTPPTPPGNWNGTFIHEVVVRHPTNGGTAVKDDFVLYPGGVQFDPDTDACVGTSGFAVGEPGSKHLTCTLGQADNRFWDCHLCVQDQGKAILKDGKDGKTIICQQKYYCGNTQLANTFKITSTWTNGTYDPAGDPPPYKVTICTFAKVKE